MIVQMYQEEPEPTGYDVEMIDWVQITNHSGICVKITEKTIEVNGKTYNIVGLLP